MGGYGRLDVALSRPCTSITAVTSRRTSKSTPGTKSRNRILTGAPLHPGGTRPVFNGWVRLAIIVSTVRVLQEVEDEPTARADGSGVGATGAAAAVRPGIAGTRLSRHHSRHLQAPTAQ